MMERARESGRRVRLAHDESGTSLLELMGAMVAGLIVLGATLQSLLYFQQQFASQQDRANQQQDLRLGLDLLEQELHLTDGESLSIIMPNEVEFEANIHGLKTNVTAAAAIGQTTLLVEDGRGWPDRKVVRVCWKDHCEQFTLARAGQPNLLTLGEPIPRVIPAGAVVAVSNRVRYYSRIDEKGVLRFLRQVDGGASVLVGGIEGVRFSYWDEQGKVTALPVQVRRIVVEIAIPRRTLKAVREISLRM